MNPNFSNLKPCSHLKDYRQSQGIKGYRFLQALLITKSHARAAIGKLQSLVPRCGLCAARGCRLYLCLICHAIFCFDHVAANPRSHHRHDIAVDIDRAELFCCGCCDQVYDPDFDNAVMAKQFLELPRSSTDGLRRKRKPRDLVAGSNGDVEKPSSHHLGLRGLNNLGNTCFMNSVLQVLFHAPPLKNYFLSDWHNRETCRKQRSRRRRKGMEATEELSCLACDVDRTFTEVFSGVQTPYSPAHFLYSWWQHSSNLACYEQQDAHEFFISILDMIHEKQVTQNKGFGDCNCIAHKVFSGMLRSDVTCTICGFTSTTYDPCLDLSLELEPLNTKSENNFRLPTLMGCLDLFTRPEKLGSDQKLYCQHCQIPQDSVKQMSIRRLPLVLCFHIKRFQHSLASRTTKKIDHSLHFPFSLDMTPYLSYSIIRNRFGNRIFAFESDESDTGSDLSSEFEILAVIAHSGRLETGHYVTYLRLEDIWYKCDDAWIHQVSEGVVRASQGYMIYYVQKQSI